MKRGKRGENCYVGGRRERNRKKMSDIKREQKKKNVKPKRKEEKNKNLEEKNEER